MTLSSISVLQNRAPLGPDEIRLRLEQMVPSLAEFGRREEAQFVRIGHRLADFLQRSREISSYSDETIDSLLRKEGDEVFVALSALMDGMNNHIIQLLAAARHHEESLLKVIVQIDRIEAPLKSLSKVVKILHSLSFSTKVESTQGHSVVVLQTLATDLKNLANKIDTKTNAVRDRLKSMLMLAQRAQEKTQTLATVSLQQADSNLQQCRRLIAIVASRRTASLADATLLQDYAGTVSAAFAEVVTSVQFHDITRQQVDHVQIALQDFCDRLADDAADPLVVEIVDLCHIQAAQLCHTRHDLVSAVRKMTVSLRSIASAVEELAQKTRLLSASAEATGASFFHDVEPILRVVGTIIAEANQDDQQATGAVAAVLGILSELSQLLQEVESIGTEMKMISFNAGITAAHNLERGAGLGVIAHTIQSLSGEVLGRTNEFAAVFRQLEQLGRELQLSPHAPCTADETENMLRNDETVSFMRRLQVMNQNVMQQMTTLEENAWSLAADVKATADTITIHVEAGKIIDQLVAELESLSESVQVSTSFSGAPKILDLLALNYTMQSERRVHAEIRKSGTGAEPAMTGEHVVRDHTGLGENVELF